MVVVVLVYVGDLLLLVSLLVWGCLCIFLFLSLFCLWFPNSFVLLVVYVIIFLCVAGLLIVLVFFW